MWAKVSETALLYFDHDISTTSFLDSVWGLRHNAATVFNKLSWSTLGVNSLLNYGRYGDPEVFNRKGYRELLNRP